MIIQKKELKVSGIKFYLEQNGTEMGRAYLYLLNNDLHKQPLGFMEDVFVDESLRGQGLGSELIKAIIEEAKKNNCYKLICNSRWEKLEVHKLYLKLGFLEHGKEFRIDFPPNP